MKIDEIKILGIVGSLRKDSYNHFALKAAQELVPDGAVLSLIDLHGIPVFDQDTEMAMLAAVLEFKRQILAADAILFATPEYKLFDCRRAQERHRLGVQALWRERLDGQAGGADGGIHWQPGHGPRAIPSSANSRYAGHAHSQSTGSDDRQCRPALLPRWQTGR